MLHSERKGELIPILEWVKNYLETLPPCAPRGGTEGGRAIYSLDVYGTVDTPKGKSTNKTGSQDPYTKGSPAYKQAIERALQHLRDNPFKKQRR